MKSFSIIVAVDEDNGIGREGRLPWHLKGDLRHFKEITTKTPANGKSNVVIMGRKTWDSLPPGFQPLPGRVNIVITRNEGLEFPPGVFKAGGLDDAFRLLGEEPLRGVTGAVYVIGGAQIFQEALRYKECRKIYLTRILRSFECDTFFPPFADCFDQGKSSPPCVEGGISYFFAEYTRRGIKEKQGRPPCKC